MRITLLLAITIPFASAQTLIERAAIPPRVGNGTNTSLASRPVDIPATEVCVGDIAPDFSYQAADARWRRLHDLVADHPALLIFGANETTLRALESEREALMKLGVLPVAIAGSRLGATRSMVQRQELRFTVVADPQRVIASQFNAIDLGTGHPLPAWFVLDSDRRVRGLGRGELPQAGYAKLVADALGLPPKAAIVPSTR